MTGAKEISPREFIGFLYAVLFDRTPEDADAAYWVQQLDHGASMLDVFEAFLASPESHRRFFKNPYFLRYLAPTHPERSFTELPPIQELLEDLKIVDVGAMLLDDEADVYQPLLASGRCKVVAFEPVEEQRRERERADPDFTVLPQVVGDGRKCRFYRTRRDAVSSIFPPNTDAMSDFEGFDDPLVIADSWSVETVRLDDVPETHDTSYLKLDVQGAELAVLEGAPALLANCPIVHCEVEFFPIYRDQPLVDAVFSFMRDRSFDLFDLPRTERYHYRGGGAPFHGTPSRLIWADAVFLASRDRLLEMPVAKQIHACWVVHEIYHGYDFCQWLLHHVDKRHGTQTHAAYQTLLESVSS